MSPGGPVPAPEGSGVGRSTPAASGTRLIREVDVHPNLKRACGWLYRRGENLVAAMIGVMFGAFLLQVVFRYLLNWPTGWSNELTVVLWIWIVLFGAAFVVREEEEIRFDLLYSAVSPRVRRAMVILGATALVGLYGYSFPAVYDYVTFMKVEKTAYLKIRFDGLYSIYLVFVIAIIARYVWLAWRAVVGPDPVEFDPTESGSGV
jgi:TRAP-type C4-dicarboxylate transport system permease small subunit